MALCVIYVVMIVISVMVMCLNMLVNEGVLTVLLFSLVCRLPWVGLVESLEICMNMCRWGSLF